MLFGAKPSFSDESHDSLLNKIQFHLAELCQSWPASDHFGKGAGARPAHHITEPSIRRFFSQPDIELEPPSTAQPSAMSTQVDTAAPNGKHANGEVAAEPFVPMKWYGAFRFRLSPL